jgi:hypothetical protein
VGGGGVGSYISQVGAFQLTQANICHTILDKVTFQTQRLLYCLCRLYTDKKEIKFSSYLRKFWMEQLQSHIWLYGLLIYVWRSICAFPHILGSPSSLLHSEFPRYIWGNLIFCFISVHISGDDVQGFMHYRHCRHLSFGKPVHVKSWNLWFYILQGVSL